MMNHVTALPLWQYFALTSACTLVGYAFGYFAGYIAAAAPRRDLPEDVSR